MTVNDLWLVRHGESIANIAATRADAQGAERIDIDVRDADVPLSATGEEQAQALASWLTAHRSQVRSFWVSPYLRARQTLAIALGDVAAHAEPHTAPHGNSHAATPGNDDPRPAITVDERLRDRELGVLDLLTRLGVERRHPDEAERRRHLGKFYHRPPGGESWADVALRLRSFLRDALDGPGEGALVVAHDAVVMLFLYLLLPLHEAEVLEFATDHTVLNASVTHLRRGPDGWQLIEFASVAHLEQEGADVTVHPGDTDAQPE